MVQHIVRLYLGVGSVQGLNSVPQMDLWVGHVAEVQLPQVTAASKV